MIHLGDITKISGYEAPIVDCIIGGSPCQGLSNAGLRKGLDDERSGLFMEQLRIVKEMRENDRRNGRTDEHIRPRYMVWENVPGAFSSNKAEDFRIVLEEIAKVCDKDAVIPMPNSGKWTTAGCIVGNGWSIAWRVCDAQFYGVPQRRRRIALIADFGGHSAPEILFVRKSLSRDTQPSQSQGKETSTDASRGTGADDSKCICFEPGAAKRLGGYVWEDLAPTLRTEVGDNRPSVAYANENFIDVEMEVSVRKYPVDCNLLCECLRDHKAASNFSNKDIAEALDVPLTKVEHWFRQDESFAIPDPDVWFDLKKLLGISTNEFDESITTFEYKGGNYDMRNRIHTSNTAPTLACGCGNNLYMLPQHEVAYTLQDREGKAGGGKGALIAEELSATLRAGFAQTLFQPVYSVENHPADSRVDIDESGKVQTLTSRMGTGGGNVPMVMECYSKSKRAQTDTDYETWKESDVANTLNAFDVGDKRTTECVVALDRASFNQGKNALYDFEVSDKGVNSPLVAKGPSAVAYLDTSDGDIAGTLDASYYKGCGLRQGRERTFVVSKAVATVDCRNGTENSDTNGTLQAHMSGGSSLNLNNVVRVKYIVRRLTPLECERLQGYPDGWTDIGEWTDSKGKVHKTSDAARYKALGNSIALPPWKWVLKRLCACYERDATMASLFDGISGFPLIWTQLNGPNSVKWTSEIEEFPIAVCKKHFGDEETGEKGDFYEAIQGKQT